MSPRTRAEIDAAPAFVRQLWAVSPAAAVQHVTDRRAFAAVLTDAADTGTDRQVAAALHQAADAATDELRRLCATDDDAAFAEVLALLGPPERGQR